MTETTFGFGILGSGFIAHVVARALTEAPSVRLAAVGSRSQANAETFAASYPGCLAAEGLEALLATDDVDAVYVAVPTVYKEAAALAAIAAGKHVLVDKPYVSAQSVQRMTEAAAAAGLVFMDATHFVHHPRRDALRAAMGERVGRPDAAHTAFYTEQADRGNIRFDPKREPMGALGDIGWYCMRAIVEYLRPEGPLVEMSAAGSFDGATGALVRCSGLLAFEGGQTATFGCGFLTGAMVDSISLYGEKGVVSLDDFVLNWTNSFARQIAEVPTGFTHRQVGMNPTSFAFVETPSATPQQVLMVEHFQELACSGDTAARTAYAEATLQTQSLLDAAWAVLT